LSKLCYMSGCRITLSWQGTFWLGKIIFQLLFSELPQTSNHTSIDM